MLLFLFIPAPFPRDHVRDLDSRRRPLVFPLRCWSSKARGGGNNDEEVCVVVERSDDPPARCRAGRTGSYRQ
jgi:hypothetical protein